MRGLGIKKVKGREWGRKWVLKNNDKEIEK